MENNFRTVVIGNGFGGNQMAAGYVQEAAQNHGLVDGYLALDTNRRTLTNLGERITTKTDLSSLFRSLVLPVQKGKNQAVHGTGFSPADAETAFRSAKVQIARVLDPFHFAIAFFALGKGTGTGFFVECVRLLLELGILPFVVASVPSTEPDEFSVTDRQDCWDRVRQVMAMGVRIFLVNRTVLHSPAFAKLKEPEGYAALNKKIQEALFLGVGRIVADPGKVDITDLCDRFVLTGAQGGLLVPAHGVLTVPSTTTDVLPEGEKNSVEPFGWITQAWQNSFVPYYDKGEVLERVLLVREGEYNVGWVNALNGCVKSSWCVGKKKSGKQRVTDSFRIISATLDESVKERSFTALLATSTRDIYTPKKKKGPADSSLLVRPLHGWRWERVGLANSSSTAPVTFDLPSAAATESTLSQVLLIRQPKEALTLPLLPEPTEPPAFVAPQPDAEPELQQPVAAESEAETVEFQPQVATEPPPPVSEPVDSLATKVVANPESSAPAAPVEDSSVAEPREEIVTAEAVVAPQSDAPAPVTTADSETAGKEAEVSAKPAAARNGENLKKLAYYRVHGFPDQPPKGFSVTTQEIRAAIRELPKLNLSEAWRTLLFNTLAVNPDGLYPEIYPGDRKPYDLKNMSVKEIDNLRRAETTRLELVDALNLIYYLYELFGERARELARAPEQTGSGNGNGAAGPKSALGAESKTARRGRVFRSLLNL